MQELYVYENRNKVIATLFEDNEIIFKTEKVTIGINGFIKKEEKKEGDGCTPIGIYNIVGTFGVNFKELKNSRIPLIEGISHLQVEELNKCFWIDDSESFYYNTMQWRTGSVNKKWKSAEDLYNELYKYAFILDYNKKCISGKGSAIFMHIAKKDLSPTKGCIAFMEDDFEKLILKIKKDVKVYIGIQKSFIEKLSLV